MMNIKDKFYNEDCINHCPERIPNNSIDLIITDPPYGIDGNNKHRHYNRNEKYVLDGYHEISLEEYPKFTYNWIKQAERILRSGGSIYFPNFRI